MKGLLLFVLAAACIAGCQGGSDEKVQPQVALNPGGKPRDAQEQSTLDVRRQNGERANQEMADAAKKRQAAMANGGH